MSRDSHQRFLEQAALREAQKAFRSRNGVRKEDFFALRVQTVEPWKRIGAIAVAFSFIAFAVWALKKDLDSWVVAIFAGFAVLLLIVGLLGSKKPVEAVLNAGGDALFRRFLDAIL